MRAAARAERYSDGSAGAGEVPFGWAMPDLDYPTFRLTLIAKVMDRLTLRRLSRRGDITYAEWRVLSRLATMPDGATVGQVAELAWVDRAEVSRAATTLEQRGLATRRANDGDRRRPILHITETGWDLYRKLADERREFHKVLLTDLDDAERAELDRLLAKVGTRLMTMLHEEQA